MKVVVELESQFQRLEKKLSTLWLSVFIGGIPKVLVFPWKNEGPLYNI
jgi:hypothetical protein